MLDISNFDVIYYVIYVICSHNVGNAISPLFAWRSSFQVNKSKYDREKFGKTKLLQRKKVNHTWSVLSQKQFIYKILIEYLKRLQRKVRKTKFKQRVITPVKVGQVWQNSNLVCFMSQKFIYQISSQYLKRRQRKVWKTKFLQRAITPVKGGQPWPNWNLSCIMSWQIHIPNFKSISQSTAEKSLEN